MVNLVNYIDKRFYPQYSNNWDDKLFREYLLTKIDKNHLVLDLGAGAGIVAAMNFKGIAREIYGIDPDPRVKDNPYLDHSYIGMGEEMPFFEDEKFDIVFCDNVFEHVENPELLLNEINRILKKGGKLISKTPNKNHYMPIIAKFTPTWFHKFYNKLRGRNESDTFKTQYKLNSLSDQSRLAENWGFEIEDIKFIEGRPEYLRLFFITYLFGLLYERFVNKLNINKYKILLIATWKKTK